MRTEPTLLVVALLAACSSSTPPVDADLVPASTGHETRADHDPTPAPSSAATSEPTGAEPSASSPAPAASSSAPATSDRCDELIKLCHDVGHSGGETGRCHELGHALDEGACAKGFDRCKTACEAAAKKTKGHTHAH